MNLRGVRLLHKITSQLPNPPFLPPILGYKSHFPSTLYSPFCSQSEDAQINAFPNGVGTGVSRNPLNKLLQVVLVSPQVINVMEDVYSDSRIDLYECPFKNLKRCIPGNTGAVARTCAAAAVGLHLVEPLGFQIDDTKLKRAGLDYWPYVVVKVHSSWNDFQDYFKQQAGEKRLLALTKRGTKIHSEYSYRKGDWLVFGSEIGGLPPEALSDCETNPYGGGTIRIPMVETHVRCLNLSVSVGIALYEASRQINYEQLQYSSEPCMDTEASIVTEDIFA